MNISTTHYDDKEFKYKDASKAVELYKTVNKSG